MDQQLKALIFRLDGYLAPRGFRRRGNRWNRDATGFIDVITLQRSKSLDQLSVNVGVQDIEVHRHWWGDPTRDVIDESDCTVRSRLPALAGGQDRAWSAADPRAAEEITELLANQGMRFIETMHRRESMVRFLKQFSPQWPQSVYLALLLAAEGDTESACAGLLEARRRLGSWARLEAEITALECETRLQM
jgi:hypothetical protein